MTNYIKRFVYIDADETQKVNPLVYPFLLSSLLYGLGFMLLGDWTGVSTSSLFRAMFGLEPFMPAAWGVLATLSSVLAIISIALRKVLLASTPSFLGFLVWMFATWVYLVNNYWLVLLTVALPNLYFWVWWYLRLKWYDRERKAGRLVDPR